MKTFSVDHHETTVTLAEIINNSELTESEINEIDNMQVGESIFIGITPIKRIS